MILPDSFGKWQLDEVLTFGPSPESGTKRGNKMTENGTTGLFINTSENTVSIISLQKMGSKIGCYFLEGSVISNSFSQINLQPCNSSCESKCRRCEPLCN